MGVDLLDPLPKRSISRRRTLQDLEVDPADQQAILGAVSARRDQVVTFEEPF